MALCALGREGVVVVVQTGERSGAGEPERRTGLLATLPQQGRGKTAAAQPSAPKESPSSRCMRTSSLRARGFGSPLPGTGTGRQAGGQAGRQAGGRAGRQAGRQAGGRVGGQAGRRAGGWAPASQAVTSQLFHFLLLSFQFYFFLGGRGRAGAAPVDVHGRGAGGEAQHATPALGCARADQCGDLSCRRATDVVRVLLGGGEPRGSWSLDIGHGPLAERQRRWRQPRCPRRSATAGSCSTRLKDLGGKLLAGAEPGLTEYGAVHERQ